MGYQAMEMLIYKNYLDAYLFILHLAMDPRFIKIKNHGILATDLIVWNQQNCILLFLMQKQLFMFFIYNCFFSDQKWSTFKKMAAINLVIKLN